jgi:hypothetical protein
MLLIATSVTLATSTLADWKPGDGHKMHWPQTPDLSATGVAVEMPLMAIRADDFRCTQSGYITDIHIWGSFEKDELPNTGPGGLVFYLSLWTNIPAYTPGTPMYNYSMPGTLLWSKMYYPGGYTVVNVTGNVSEGWYDPEMPEYVANDHIAVFQYNFDVAIAESYEQEENNIYWLGVQHYVTLPGKFGWKSTDPTLQWNDNAVRQTAAGWLPLEYPSDHVYAGQPLDLAFVINGTSVPTFTIAPWPFTPVTLNLASKGRWVMGKIAPPEGYDVGDIELSSVLLEGMIPADWGQATGSELMLKFDRSDLEDILDEGTYSLKISGRLSDGQQFEGWSRVITFTGLE